MRTLIALVLVSGMGFSLTSAAQDFGINRRPPPGRNSYLCDGTFWGGFSNGVRASMTLVPRGRNSVDVYINIDGGYRFEGSGTCNAYRGGADLDFFVRGPGTDWGRGWGSVWQNGPGATVQGRMENGLTYQFTR